MKEFRKLKSLDEIPEIKVGEILGFGQPGFKPTLSMVTYNDGNKLKVLGNFFQRNKTVVEYTFLKDRLWEIYEDGSINGLADETRYIERHNNSSFKYYKQKLIEAGIWEEAN